MLLGKLIGQILSDLRFRKMQSLDFVALDLAGHHSGLTCLES
jgi:hypothetical protein